MILRCASPWIVRQCVMALLLAAVLAQTLGLMHRSAHNPLHTSQHVHAHVHHDADEDQQSDAQAAGHASHGHIDYEQSWVAALFSGHADDASCRLVDAQSSFNFVFSTLGQVFIDYSAIKLIAFSQITSKARAAALFEARGPPASL
jgi:hypothetical protein